LIQKLIENRLPVLLARDQVGAATTGTEGDHSQAHDDGNACSEIVVVFVLLSELFLQLVVLCLEFDILLSALIDCLVDFGTREEVTISCCTKTVLSTRHPPSITVRSFDRHIVHLPCIVIAFLFFCISFVILLMILIAAWFIDGIMPLPVESSVRVTLVEASFLDEESLTLWGQRATSVPEIFASVALLELLCCHDGAMRTTSTILPGMAFCEVVRLRARSVLVVIIQMALFVVGPVE